MKSNSSPILKLENRKKPLLPLHKFYKRLFYNFLIALLIVLISLSLGVWGYMSLANLNFIDGLLNASMILGGMGPVDILNNNGAKIFASFYALYSGITILTVVGILIAPILHRAMHRFHLEMDEEDKN